MLKAKGLTPGGPVIVIGITAENIEHLIATGQALVIDLDEVGIPNTEMRIFYGQSLEDLYLMVKPLVDKETRINMEGGDHFGKL